jgi:predicted nucleic acid-binding protein
MNGTAKRYLFDTNVLIYYFNGDPIVQPIVEEVLQGMVLGFYSPITWTELLCYPALTTDEAEAIREFLRSLNSVSLTEAVLDRAANIRSNFRTAIPDALIAACAIETEAILVTRNVKDFQNIPDIPLLNPFLP